MSENVSTILLSTDIFDCVVGDVINVTAQAFPNNHTEDTNLFTWSCNKGTISHTEENNLSAYITITDSGTASISLSSPSGVIGSISVTVTQPATDILASPNVTSLVLGQTLPVLQYTLLPANSTDSVVYTSSDSSIIEVSGHNLRVMTSGTCQITLTTSSGVSTFVTYTIYESLVTPEIINPVTTNPDCVKYKTAQFIVSVRLNNAVSDIRQALLSITTTHNYTYNILESNDSKYYVLFDSTSQVYNIYIFDEVLIQDLQNDNTTSCQLRLCVVPTNNILSSVFSDSIYLGVIKLPVPPAPGTIIRESDIRRFCTTLRNYYNYFGILFIEPSLTNGGLLTAFEMSELLSSGNYLINYVRTLFTGCDNVLDNVQLKRGIVAVGFPIMSDDSCDTLVDGSINEFKLSEQYATHTSSPLYELYNMLNQL